MEKFILSCLIILNGCATASYRTVHGIEVYDKTTENTPTQSEVEQVTKYVIRYLGHAKKLNGTKLMLVNKWIQVPQPNGKVILMDGITNVRNKEIIASVFQTCFADSGAIHELAHVIHDYDSGIPDWWHDDKVFWDNVTVLEKEMVKDLCPKDYKARDIGPNFKPKEK